MCGCKHRFCVSFTSLPDGMPDWAGKTCNISHWLLQRELSMKRWARKGWMRDGGTEQKDSSRSSSLLESIHLRRLPAVNSVSVSSLLSIFYGLNQTCSSSFCSHPSPWPPVFSAVCLSSVSMWGVHVESLNVSLSSKLSGTSNEINELICLLHYHHLLDNNSRGCWCFTFCQCHSLWLRPAGNCRTVLQTTTWKQWNSDSCRLRSSSDTKRLFTPDCPPQNTTYLLTYAVHSVGACLSFPSGRNRKFWPQGCRHIPPTWLPPLTLWSRARHGPAPPGGSPSRRTTLKSFLMGTLQASPLGSRWWVTALSRCTRILWGPENEPPPGSRWPRPWNSRAGWQGTAISSAWSESDCPPPPHPGWWCSADPNQQNWSRDRKDKSEVLTLHWPTIRSWQGHVIIHYN